MTVQNVSSFAMGQWIAPGAGARPIASAIDGKIIAQSGNDALNVGDMMTYAREVGGPALQKLTFHDRARMLKALAQELNKHKDALYDLSYLTGANLRDHAFDIDGGIGTMFVYASKGRREMPDSHVYMDGPPEQLSRNGTFLGQHVCTPLQGVALHINAFNFPLWGMLEKVAPTLLAGVPAIVKPATATSYVAELGVRIMIHSGILPDGALQLISGGVGDAMENLTCQDVLSFTGSAYTARKLRGHAAILDNAVRFVAEQDSLNASILGPDAVPGTPEFDLFVKEAHREMTTKAGQKCTAIRRMIVPESHAQAVADALSAKLAATPVGDPRDTANRMGALVSADQKQDVLERAEILATEATRVFGDPDGFTPNGDPNGAYISPMLFLCENPDAAQRVHDTEAFGPVSTIMPYRDVDHAMELANRGGGSLVTSVITHDGDVARKAVMSAGAWHGRIYLNDRNSMAESTGHGAPMPHMIHGGPGRAGGGEEMGGVRGVKHYMQRTAIQGSPDMITAVTGRWQPGAAESTAGAHPFTRRFHELQIGETLHTAPRTITLEDIEHFAHFTGDTFYAHMDEDAAKRNPFFPGRVAHGYLLLSFAAGMFVQPDEGPVLANTGLDALRFMQPVSAGDVIKVRLTVKHKTPRNDEYGEIRWHVTLTNQEGALVAEYELLTMVAC